MRPPRPPRLAQRLLAWLLAPADREPALGDLHEEYASILSRRGGWAARRWYWGQALQAVGPALRRRGVPGTVALTGLAQEVRWGVRALLRRPGLTASSVATLAVGIGFTTAIFSVVHAVLLRPLPFTGGERLVQVWLTYPGWRGHEVLDAYWDRIDLSWPEYLDWREDGTAFEAVGVYGTVPAPLTGGGDPEQVLVGVASASLLPMLGVTPVLGRSFAAGEEGPDAPRVALLAHGVWERRFGADRAVLGRSVELDGRPYTVIGVLPPGFHLRATGLAGSEAHGVWVPVGSMEEELGPGNHSYEALGRLAPGVSWERARTATERTLTAGTEPGSRGVRLAFRKEAEVGEAREPLLLLLGAVSVLLLIACGNVAMLLAGETARRRRELATRSALGAGGGRIVRQLVLESTLLGLGGAAGGVLVAAGAVRLLLRLAPEGLPVPDGPVLDPWVLGFAAALGLGTGLLVGVMPGIRAARARDVRGDLRARGEEHLAGRTLQRCVLVGQVALSLVLLAVGGLLARTASELGAVEPGFDPEGVLTARVSLADGRYTRDEATGHFLEIVRTLSGADGIDGATLVSEMPFSGRTASSSFQVVGREVPPEEKQPEGNRRVVLPGYHEVLGIPLVAGRYLQPSDRVFEAPVVVLSRLLAERYWPGGDVLGQRISRDRREWEVVGVVEDVLHSELAATAQPTFYVPYEVAELRHAMTLVVRSGLPRGPLVERVREAVWEVVPDAPVEEVLTAPALLARSTREERFRSVLLVAFALAATVLSAVGLFGVTGRLVGARRRELGIRLALGAERWELVRGVVLREGGVLVLGVAAGVAAAVVAGRLLSGFLFGVAPGDPLSIGGAALLLTLTGLTACWGAARRGTAVDPVEAIRVE